MNDREPAPAGAALLPIFGSATIIGTVAICVLLAFPSVTTVAIALVTIIGFAAALVAVLGRLIGPEPH
jgi:hypothetical protein